jgi:hypothetical protein
MRDGQSNYWNMLNAVLQHFDDNIPVWKGVEIVVKCIEDLKNNGTAIKVAATKQRDSNPIGHTIAKERSRNELENITFQVAIRARSYARLIEDDVLTEKLNFSRSNLDRMKHNDLLTCSRVVFDACRNYLPALAPYQVDEKIVDRLSQCIEQTTLLYAERDTVIDQRMEATADLAKQFITARKYLKTLDDLVEGYIEDDTFVATYFNTRRIHDLKGRRASKKEE